MTSVLSGKLSERAADCNVARMGRLLRKVMQRTARNRCLLNVTGTDRAVVTVGASNVPGLAENRQSDPSRSMRAGWCPVVRARPDGATRRTRG